MTDADKREARARASGAASKTRAVSGVGQELVAVDVECAAPDRVVVKLSFPPLSG